MIAGLDPYPDYNESGLPWLGRVPRHWKLRRLRHLIKGRLTYGANAAAEFTNPDWPRYIRITDFRTDGSLKADTFRSLPPNMASDYMVDPGDILLARSGATVGKAFLVAKLAGAACHAGYLIRARPNCRLVSSEFLFAFTQSSAFAAWKDSTFNTATIQKIGADKYANLTVPFPPPEEQAAIARFLGWANGRLERAIRAKRKVIALLNEQKQAIIRRAVTRGLNPTAPLKTSRNPWLGKIPEHWEERRAKYFCREVDDRSPAGAEELLSVSHITGVTPRSQKNITMFMAESYVGHKTCEPGDIVINTMWAWMGALGVASQRGIVSPSYGVYRLLHADDFIPDFVDCLIRSKPFVDEYRCRSTGIRSSRLRLYPEQFLDIPLPRPPYEEQERITAFVVANTRQLYNLMAEVAREVALIREYRTRLVSDVVTGQLDVRQVAARLPEETQEPEPLNADSEDAESIGAADELEAEA
jgi:type I restriction enzyme S subunit